ncbi:hypothetical protein [Sinosporangium album]|uniref:hypothetical protein n=1 Tax=Sinosporangium album TaxID=504805 RepID=UPI000B82A355|nr:hypothetical protein [Sinosporangium album]
MQFGARIVPLGERDIWAFGTRKFREFTLGATAFHWDGEKWRKNDPPSEVGTSVAVAGASSPTNVWVVGGGDDPTRGVARWDGGAWVTMSRVPTRSVEDIEVLGEDDVWLFGSETWHYTRGGWSRVEMPMSVYRAAAASADDIWVAGSHRHDQRRQLVGHYDGDTWRIVPLGDRLLPDASFHTTMVGVAADGPDVWITVNAVPGRPGPTTPILLRRTEGRWSSEAVTRVAGHWRETADPVPDGRGGVWFLGTTDVNGYDSALAHRSAVGAWTLAPVSPSAGGAEFNTLTAIPGTSRLLATGHIEQTPGIFLHQVKDADHAGPTGPSAPSSP